MTPNREHLENSRAALAVLLRLAEYGRAACEENDRYPNREKPNNDSELARQYVDGAGAVEPDAVVAWVKGELARLDNTLDALDGAVGHDCDFITICRTCGRDGDQHD